MYWDAKKYSKHFLFTIPLLKILRLSISIIQLLQGLPLYDELSVLKRNQVHLVDMQEVIKLK